MIEIDGVEGGGQILRTSLGLSALTRQAFRIKNIRVSRPKTGLAAQHLACVKLMAELCNAHVEGDELGSTELFFVPREYKTKDMTFDIGTAGSITLMLQSALIPLIFAKKRITLSITGGTDVRWSPPVDYMKYVIIPHLDFAEVHMNILKKGYFPKGNGKVELKVKPMYPLKDDFNTFHKEMLEHPYSFARTKREKIIQISGVSHAASELESSQVSERQALSAKSVLNSLGCEVNIRTEYGQSLSVGSGITLYARDSIGSIIGTDALGKRGKKAEEVGKTAAERLLEELKSGQPIDVHLADNLIPYLAIFGGEIAITKLSNHVKTNIKTTEIFLGGKFNIEGNRISYNL